MEAQTMSTIKGTPQGPRGTSMTAARRELSLGEWWLGLSQSARFDEWRKLSQADRRIVTDYVRAVNGESDG